MKKTLILMMTISTINAFGTDIKISTGQSSYFYVHSRVANILAPRSAELEAYSEVLNSIVETCRGENFKLDGDVKFYHRFDPMSPEINVLAKQNFTCIEF